MILVLCNNQREYICIIIEYIKYQCAPLPRYAFDTNCLYFGGRYTGYVITLTPYQFTGSTLKIEKIKERKLKMYAVYQIRMSHGNSKIYFIRQLFFCPCSYSLLHVKGEERQRERRALQFYSLNSGYTILEIVRNECNWH